MRKTESKRAGGGKRVKFENDAVGNADDTIHVIESRGKKGGKRIRFKLRSEK